MCDTLVRVQDGEVLFAKSSDRDPNEAQLLDWQPGRRHDAGARLRCTWIEIPQVRETLPVLLSRPFWMWGAEIAANAAGVAIGNEAVFTRQPYAAEGLTGMDLVRLVAERAQTARQGVEVLLALLEAHGQGGGCGHEKRSFTYHNSFLIADAGGAFVVETAGRHHAVEEVNGARSISNGLTIPGFAEQHASWLEGRVAACATRRARTEALAGGAEGPADLFRALRDHGEGRQVPSYRWLNGGMDAPCMHAGGLAAASQTTASWVARLRPDGAEHWVTATSAPCTALFKPVRVEEPLELGPAPTDQADEASLWWRHERLHRLVARDPRGLLPLYLGERDALEAAWLDETPPPAEAFAEGDRRLRSWTERVREAAGPDRRPWYVRRYWGTRDRRAGLGSEEAEASAVSSR